VTGEPWETDAAAGARRVRASDADRHEVVHRLQEAVARGQLTFDEGSERMSSTWTSRYLDELPPLTADLPAPVPAAAAAPGWRALGLLALLQLRTTLGGAAGPASRAARVRLAAASVAALLLVGLLLGVVLGVAAHGPDAGAFAGPRFRH
jgi:Domain of unknown function (DUF1707)